MANDYKEYQFVGHVRLKKLTVRCFRCSARISVRFDLEALARGIKPPPRLCGSCRDLDPEGYLFGDFLHPEQVGNVEDIIRKNAGRITCKHYRPGDPGFDEIAAQCTPPKLIKDHTRIPFLDWGKL